MEEKIVEIDNNLSLSVRIIGDCKKETILLVNGSIFNYRQFDESFLPLLRSMLPDAFTFVNYDYVGIGDSSDINGNYDIIGLADQQSKLIEVLGLEQVHLFGYSQGSLVSQIMTAKYPHLVASLAAFGSPNLADDAALIETEEEFRNRLENVRSLSNIYGERINKANYKLVYDTVYLPTIFIDKHADELGFLEKIINWYVRKKLKPMLVGTKIDTINRLYSYYVTKISPEEQGRYVDAVKSITAPTLLMHGDEDEIIPQSSSELLAEWIPQAQLKIYSGYSHAELLLRKKKAKPVVGEYVEFLTNNL